MNGKSTIEFFEIGREGKNGSVLDFRIMCRPASSKQSWLAYYFDNLEEICNNMPSLPINFDLGLLPS
jgi:hypothetical protein